MNDIIIVGGGLAGLVHGITLARKNRRVLLLEKKSYPFHRVCGEYISNEVKPYLHSIDCFPAHLEPSEINRFQLTSTQGKSVVIPLEMGGFGLSRFQFDSFLAQRAEDFGVEIKTNIRITKISWFMDHFQIQDSNGDTYTGKVVIGAFGKRSVLDKSMDRSFMKKRSPYVGVKYHIQAELDSDIVALHNFQGGYCGISKIENNRYNLCYLASREVLRTTGNISSMEQNILMKNPWLQDVFSNSNFLFDQPEVINEISFARKEPVCQHVLMTGDAAGMITPLCGNGMAMAIHSAKISSGIVDDFLEGKLSRADMERSYSRIWQSQFAFRLWVGRSIQKLFGSGRGSDFAVSLLNSSLRFSTYIISQTHGKPF